MLMGLIPVGLKTSYEVKHQVLKDSGRTDQILLLGRLWWWWMGGSLWRWWMGGGLASVTLGVDWEAKPGLILSKLILIRGFIARVIHRYGACVDPTRSTSRRDSLLNGRKMWVDFRVLENPSSRRTVILWSRHLLLVVIL